MLLQKSIQEWWKPVKKLEEEKNNVLLSLVALANLLELRWAY